MIDVADEVFTKVQYYISDKYPDALVTNDTPSSMLTTFPCAVIAQTDNPTFDTDLDNTEVSVNPTFQCEVYMNGSDALGTSKSVEAIIDSSMKDMGFSRKSGWMKVDNLSDITILRRIARYQRLIADGDTI